MGVEDTQFGHGAHRWHALAKAVPAAVGEVLAAIDDPGGES